MSKFVYYNVNPKGYKENDCVCRAISLATQLPYTKIQEKLYYTSKLLNCEKLCVCCYRHLLEDVFKFEQIDPQGFLVGEFADFHPFGVYLARIEGHITCIKNNTIYDIWDCRKEEITDVWRVD